MAGTLILELSAGWNHGRSDGTLQNWKLKKIYVYSMKKMEGTEIQEDKRGLAAVSLLDNSKLERPLCTRSADRELHQKMVSVE